MRNIYKRRSHNCFRLVSNFQYYILSYWIVYYSLYKQNKIKNEKELTARTVFKQLPKYYVRLTLIIFSDRMRTNVVNVVNSLTEGYNIILTLK